MTLTPFHLKTMPDSAKETTMDRDSAATRIIHDARKVYEDHKGDGAWLAMERAYFDLISAAVQSYSQAGKDAAPVAWRYQRAGWHNIWRLAETDPASPGFFESPGDWIVEPLYAAQPANSGQRQEGAEPVACIEKKIDKAVLSELNRQFDVGVRSITSIDTKAFVNAIIAALASPQSGSEASSGASSPPMVSTVRPTDATVAVLVEALYHCGCPAGGMRVGDCAEQGVCGCSIHAERLKGCMGPEHQTLSRDERRAKALDELAELDADLLPPTENSPSEPDEGEDVLGYRR